MNLIRTLVTIIGIFTIFGIGTLSCEKVDKALETVDKANNLRPRDRPLLQCPDVHVERSERPVTELDRSLDQEVGIVR